LDESAARFIFPQSSVAYVCGQGWIDATGSEAKLARAGGPVPSADDPKERIVECLRRLPMAQDQEYDAYEEWIGTGPSGPWSGALASPQPIVFGLKQTLSPDREPREDLWRSDGTHAGTTIVLPLAERKQEIVRRYGEGHGPAVYSLGTVGDRLIFVLFPSDSWREEAELWASDGTALGTRYLARLPGVKAVARQGDRLVVLTGFFASGSRLRPSVSQELIVTDGTRIGERIQFDWKHWSTQRSADPDQERYKLQCGESGCFVASFNPEEGAVRVMRHALAGNWRSGKEPPLSKERLGEPPLFVQHSKDPNQAGQVDLLRIGNSVVLNFEGLTRLDLPMGPQTIAPPAAKELLCVDGRESPSVCYTRLTDGTFWKTDGTKAGTVPLPEQRQTMTMVALRDVRGQRHVLLMDREPVTHQERWSLDRWPSSSASLLYQGPQLSARPAAYLNRELLLVEELEGRHRFRLYRMAQGGPPKMFLTSQPCINQ
jgi:hypothetical protein